MEPREGGREKPRRRADLGVAGASRLQARGLGQVHSEAVAAPLVAAGHFRRSVAEVLLDVAFVDLGRRGEPGAQRVPGKLLLPVAFGQIAAHARGDRQALDEARDVAVVETFGTDLAPDHRPEQRPTRNARELQPGLERGDRAGRVLRAAADLDLAPAGLAPQRSGARRRRRIPASPMP